MMDEQKRRQYGGDNDFSVVATKKSQQRVKMFLPSLSTSCKFTSTDKHWNRIVSTGELKSLQRLFGWILGVGTKIPAHRNKRIHSKCSLVCRQTLLGFLVCPDHSSTYNLGGAFKTRIDDRDVDFSYDRQCQLLLIRLCFCDVHDGNNAVSPFVQFCSLDDHQSLVSVGDCLVNRNQISCLHEQEIDSVSVTVEKINHSSFVLVLMH